MKVIIAGSREGFNYQDVVAAVYLSGFELEEVVSGGARGVDSLGEKYAKEYGIDLTVFYPNWSGKGRSAGHIRNRKMGDYSEGLIALWDGESKGTKGMIDYMNKLNKPVYVYLLSKNRMEEKYESGFNLSSTTKS